MYASGAKHSSKVYMASHTCCCMMVIRHQLWTFSAAICCLSHSRYRQPQQDTVDKQLGDVGHVGSGAYTCHA